MSIGITPELVAEHGLTAHEYALFVNRIGRTLSLAELGVLSAMWSEHCSYKSSRVWLAKLPTEAPHVIQGPGENAGVVDIGDGWAVVFKMESHNHPSFIEPYQGAATGVGGILRDVFTMGARPIANLNALRFGDPAHPGTRHILAGVVAGIGGYGNCVGVPTVGGLTAFDAAYNGNPLVNAMTVGLARHEHIHYARGAAVGSPVVYVGSKTGRDGIHGATMSSAEFSEDSEARRPTVQVGDPFTEKLLLEACLELMATDAIQAIQDMGAAGLTSSGVEMADKGGVGIELDLDRVPLREAGMSAYEILLSESQERMLMVLKPGREAEAEAIFAKYELDFAIIGQVTDTKHFVVRRHGQVEVDLPVAPLVDDAPKYQRPFVRTSPAAAIADPGPLPRPLFDILKQLLGSPDLSSRRWITEQYDSLVRGDTLVPPSVGEAPASDAAIVRIPGNRALAMTVDCTPRYCVADPVEGGRQAVAEAWRNLVASGARPLAITDNMNFGNPEKPGIMGQFAGCIEGMAEACRALDFPVVSGNVSLYNETEGSAILPTPTIGGVGVIDDLTRRMHAHLGDDDLTLVLIGGDGTHLGRSAYRRDVLLLDDGPPPPVDLAAERRHGDFIARLIAQGSLSACHDLSDGGLLIALAEMALWGDIGVTLSTELGDINDPAFWFGEDQARYLVATSQDDALLDAAAAAGIAARIIGRSGGDSLKLPGGSAISLEALRAAHEGWLPRFMDG